MPLEPSEIFKALGVETRIKIVELLKAHGPMGVNSLSERLGITPAAVSQHLRVLRHAGFVTPERQGYWIPYSLDEEALEHCRCLVNDVCCHGPVEHEAQKLDGSSVSDLRAYEKELRSELERVQRRIEKLSAKDE